MYYKERIARYLPALGPVLFDKVIINPNRKVAGSIPDGVVRFFR